MDNANALGGQSEAPAWLAGACGPGAGTVTAGKDREAFTGAMLDCLDRPSPVQRTR
jgi:hypothetical protein